jgi:hypothetical protein
MAGQLSRSSLINLTKTKWQRQCAWLALLIVLIAGAWHDLALLTHYSVAVGVDGYYYVLQINWFRNFGYFYFPAKTSLILYLLTGISYLTGDTILSIKIGSVILHVLLCSGIFAVIVSATRCVWLGVLGCALASISGLRFYMIAEFINYLGAITFLTWCVWCVIRASQTHRKLWALLSIILFIGAAFSHRAAIVLAIIIACSALLWRLMIQESSKTYQYSAWIIFAIVLFTPAIIAIQPFVSIPDWVRDQITFIPHLPFSRATLAEAIILLTSSAAVLFLVNRLRQSGPINSYGLVMGSISIWAFLVTLNPFLDPTRGWLSVAGRLQGLAYIQSAVLVPGLIRLAISLRLNVALYLVALILPLMILSMEAPKPIGIIADYLSNRENMIRQLPESGRQLGAAPIIIAPHGDEFIVTSVLGIPSQHSWPKSNQYQTIYWLLHRIDRRLLMPTAIVIAADGEDTFTALVENSVLEKQLASITVNQLQFLFANNPHLYRYISHKS